MVNFRLQQKHFIFLKKPEPLTEWFAYTLIKIIHIVQSVYECRSMHACVSVCMGAYVHVCACKYLYILGESEEVVCAVFVW